MKLPLSVLFIGTLLCISAIYQTQNYGLPGATQVGSFVNGALPFQSTPSGQSSLNMTAVKATPYLAFDKILSLTAEPHSNNIYVSDRHGYIQFYDDNQLVNTKTTFLDISAKIWKQNGTVGHVQETGIFNMTFHPEFNVPGSPNRNYFYIFYTAEINGVKKLRISRFTRPTGSLTADPNSEMLLIDQNLFNYDYHRGGGLAFGNDGFLYISIGDLNDPTLAQQNTTYFCGAVLRIDVDMNPITSHPIRRTLQSVQPNSFSGNYYIPFDNPWQHANGSILEEYYAFGFRNPHRMTVDSVSGKLFIGEVGSLGHPDVTEEINMLERGANYGWPFREGVTNIQPVPSYQGHLVDPIVHYPHSNGNICVIGGVVYRGTQNPALYGRYIFGDYNSNRIWAADVFSGTSPVQVDEIGIFQNGSLVTFGYNPSGEVILANAHTAQEIFELQGQTGFPTPPPGLLSLTGAFTQTASLTPASFMIPYDVNTPLWSDGAIKKRWFILPNDGTLNDISEQICFTASGEWSFPVGAVLVKHFELPIDANNPSLTRKLETRFLVHGQDGIYYPLTYKWQADGSDAVLQETAVIENYAVTNAQGNTVYQAWHYPGKAECYSCHTEASGRVLGPSTRQLNGDFTYPGSGITANQLASLNHIGAFNFDISNTLSTNLLTNKSLSDSTASIQERALSYLDANCSGCHRPGGPGLGTFDALRATPLDQNGMIRGNVVNALGIPNAKLINPGDTATSMLYQRMVPTLGCCRMPGIGVQLEDEVATKAIADWINSMNGSFNPCVPAEAFLSDLTIASSTNGDGPVELDMSNGFGGANDGTPISLGNIVYPKGLGVHANSEIIFNINGAYDEIRGVVGLDDSKNNCALGSVQFSVYGDGQLLFESPVINRGDDPKTMSVRVTGVNQLKLEVDDTGDNNYCDHASWGGIKGIKFCDDPCTASGQTCDDGDVCTTNDRYDSYCACIGDFVDSDNDGICDALDSSPFPVEWLSFEADQIENDALLKWSTASETGNSHFNILRGWDGQEFEKIGSVAGQGTTRETSSYLFTDPQMVRFGKNKIYYRIEQVDMNGLVTMSNILSLGVKLPTLLVEAYPSVFQDEIHIDIHQEKTKGFVLKMVDAQGRIVWQQPVTQQTQQFRIPTSDWAASMYFLIYTNDGNTRVKKLVKE